MHGKNSQSVVLLLLSALSNSTPDTFYLKKQDFPYLIIIRINTKFVVYKNSLKVSLDLSPT